MIIPDNLDNQESVRCDLEKLYKPGQGGLLQRKRIWDLFLHGMFSAQGILSGNSGSIDYVTEVLYW
jgi:hypothetical protein